MEKIGCLEVSRKSSKLLTWVLISYLLIEALVQAGDYIGLARVSHGPIIYGISRITQSRVGEILLSLCSTGLLLTIWEMFRRSLAKIQSILWYLVLAIMALVFCDFLVSLIPNASGSLLEQVQNPTRFDTFATRFRTVSGGLQLILGLILSVALIVKYKSRLRVYGWVSIICPVAWSFVMGAAFSYMVDHTVEWLSSGLSVLTIMVRYVLGVLPFIFLRRTMVYKSVHESDYDGDLNGFGRNV